MKNKKIFFMVLAFTLILTSCNGANENYNSYEIDSYESIIINKGIETLEKIDTVPGRSYSVVKNGNEYIANFNGDIQVFEIMEYDISEIYINNISDVNDKKIIDMINTSLEKVICYIKKSDILNEKEEIIEYIKNIPIKMGDFESPAMYKDNCIYISNLSINYICEWMLVHEYIHALAEFTNKGIENEKYSNSMYNETITDIITESLGAKIPNEISSKYIYYYGETVYLFIGCMKEDVIKAYFYGYENLYEKVDENEMDLFVHSIDNINNEIAFININNFINKYAIESEK